ncbi:MAG: hypothetical protein EZS28_040230, partial [Streblomastix strix]
KRKHKKGKTFYTQHSFNLSNVARTKQINIQASPSTQLQGNHIRDPEVEMQGRKTHDRFKATSTNASVIANQNQSKIQLRRQLGASSRTVSTSRNSEQNKGEDSYSRHLSSDSNAGNITTSINLGNEGKNISLPRDMEISKLSGVHIKKFFLLFKSEASLETEENSGYEFNEYGDTNCSNQDELIRLSERFDKEKRLPYQAFEAMGKVYQYRAMPFETQHSPIFFVQALAMVLYKKRRDSDIRILICEDDLCLQYQNKERQREQSQIIMRILEALGWTIAQDKCETEPKQQINFQGQSWDLIE